MRKIIVGLSVLLGLAIVCGQLSAGERVRRERRYHGVDARQIN